MRYEKIDIIRAIAVICMIAFHFRFSTFELFGVKFLGNDILWIIIGKFSALTFMALSGVSFALAEKKYQENILGKYADYSLKLCLLAVGISFGSFIFIPDMRIIFGILHFFSLAFLLLLLFRKAHYWNLLIGIFLLVIPLHISFSSSEMTPLYILGFVPNSFNSLDYYPLIPNFGYVLIGYALGTYLILSNRIRFFSIKKKGIALQGLLFVGRHSLAIYIIHLPFLFIIPFVYFWIFGI